MIKLNDKVEAQFSLFTRADWASECPRAHLAFLVFREQQDADSSVN